MHKTPITLLCSLVYHAPRVIFYARSNQGPQTGVRSLHVSPLCGFLDLTGQPCSRSFTMKSTLIKAVSIAAFAALATGCASSSQLDEVRSIAEAAQRSADEAKQSAAGAERTASDAKRIAEEAKRSADEANSKIDRAFKTSMQK
ncbi:MAG: hypothetical protein CME43_03755 [Haliea sp.]|nr:hypothetical protein [Haliea sp.]